MSETTHKITIVDTLREDLAVRQLIEAEVKASGELVMEGYSVGSGVSSAFGDSDIEYDLAVSADEVPRVLLELIRDQFRHPVAFKNWLIRRNIPYRVLNFY